MRALVHTAEKTGIVDFARGLHDLGWEITATAGTGSVLSEARVPITPIADLVDCPMMLGGRVKVLHSKVFGGLLYRRDVPEHLADVATYEIPSIDLVACNFYRFTESVTFGSLALEAAQDLIDVGGPATIRAAAKNFQWVIPLVDPSDYSTVLAILRATNGSPKGVSLNVRHALAMKAFEYTRDYDGAIVAYLQNLVFD